MNYAAYPWNPNGSLHNIAGLCNPEGTILGLMPHPERAFYTFMDSEWTRKSRVRQTDEEEAEVKGYGDGKKIFEAVLNYLRNKAGE
jgi:phosphoribosylformylglycinamidine (FGAM) synthase-like amidotransferase family enzyme